MSEHDTVQSEHRGVDEHDGLSAAPRDTFDEGETLHPSLGACLQAAREQRALAVADCARALRLPTRLLEKLESNDYSGIDYAVYLRSYLRTYAEYLQLDECILAPRLAALQARQPDLVAPQSVPLWKKGIHRYVTATTYAVLTVLIVAPLIWFGVHKFTQEQVQLTPLNAHPVDTPTQVAGNAQAAAPDQVAGAVQGSRSGSNGTGHTAPPPVPEKPLMASVAPFSAMELGSRPEAAAGTAHAAPPTRLSILLMQPSWIEITGPDGQRIEYALLPAGTHRDYADPGKLNVRIGNADGARVQVDGKPVSLGAYQHAKVAHFDVLPDGSLQPDNT